MHILAIKILAVYLLKKANPTFTLETHIVDGESVAWIRISFEYGIGSIFPPDIKLPECDVLLPGLNGCSFESSLLDASLLECLCVPFWELSILTGKTSLSYHFAFPSYSY